MRLNGEMVMPRQPETAPWRRTGGAPFIRDIETPPWSLRVLERCFLFFVQIFRFRPCFCLPREINPPPPGIDHDFNPSEMALKQGKFCSAAAFETPRMTQGCPQRTNGRAHARRVLLLRRRGCGAATQRHVQVVAAARAAGDEQIVRCIMVLTASRTTAWFPSPPRDGVVVM